MLKKSFYLCLVLTVGFVAFSTCESDETTTPSADKTFSTRRMRFTRRSTTPTTTIDEISKSTTTETFSSTDTTRDVTNSSETVESIESSIVTGESIITVEISTKKSLRVRNCGERIGDDIPFIAVLVHTNPFEKESPKKKMSLSKGVLISDQFVMATVSSVYHSESFWTVSSVRLGDFVTWNKYALREKSQRVEIDVDEIFYHKKKDLALIKLKETVTFTDIIRPACLPSSDSYNFKQLQTHLCKRSEHSKTPADVTLEFAAPLSSYDCRQFFTRKRMTVSSQEFCVWDEVGDDCTGDIGNPLFTIHNGRFFVVGLRSYVESDDDFIEPGEYPGVYVKIGSMLNWISTVINYDEKKAEKQ